MMDRFTNSDIQQDSSVKTRSYQRRLCALIHQQ